MLGHEFRVLATWFSPHLPSRGVTTQRTRRNAVPPVLGVLLVIASSCGGGVTEPSATAGTSLPAASAVAQAGPLRIALASHRGEAPLDLQIREMQAKVAEKVDAPRLERLATMFISKARSSGDSGFYKQAEACAQAMQPLKDGGPASQLVLGHVRHAMHDFPAAERIARELVASRGMFLDLGLLGDVLLDQGRLDEARDVYQRMVDIKPCLQSYSRIAQLRWLQGDLAGARELLASAASAGSQRDPESLAWVAVRRAQLELQVGDAPSAKRHADQALVLVPDYPAALAMRGRAAWALGDKELAVRSLTEAAERSMLPEHLWAQADVLRAVGRTADAEVVEATLLRCGEREDPRTFALWLATTSREVPRALQLAETELLLRQDVLTQDVLALARLRQGDLVGAHDAMRQALSTGVRDPRLQLHAGAIALSRGERTVAAEYFEAARLQQDSLLPCERKELASLIERI